MLVIVISSGSDTDLEEELSGEADQSAEDLPTVQGVTDIPPRCMQETTRSTSTIERDHCLFKNKQGQPGQSDRSVDSATVCINFLSEGEEDMETEYSEHDLFDKEHFSSCNSCVGAIMMAVWFKKF